jgi:hypothetical protein
VLTNDYVKTLHKEMFRKVEMGRHLTAERLNIGVASYLVGMLDATSEGGHNPERLQTVLNDADAGARNEHTIQRLGERPRRSEASRTSCGPPPV